MNGVRYFRPGSLSWWAGVLMVALGLLGLVLPENALSSELGIALHALTGEGTTSPGLMIGSGLGLIGVRDAIKRELSK